MTNVKKHVSPRPFQQLLMPSQRHAIYRHLTKYNPYIYKYVAYHLTCTALKDLTRIVTIGPFGELP